MDDRGLSATPCHMAKGCTHCRRNLEVPIFIHGESTKMKYTHNVLGKRHLKRRSAQEKGCWRCGIPSAWIGTGRMGQRVGLQALSETGDHGVPKELQNLHSPNANCNMAKRVVLYAATFGEYVSDFFTRKLTSTPIPRKPKVEFEIWENVFTI